MQRGVVDEKTSGFLGVNLRRDRLSLADGEVAKAINADLHTQPGAAILRLGRSRQDSTVLSDLVIRRIARINSNRFRVAGQSLYCSTTRIINGLLSANLLTTLTPFRPLNDTTIWNFVADDAIMRKTTCSTVQKWGLEALAAITIAGGWKASGLTGTYIGRATAIRFDGTAVAHEGNAAAPPTAVVLTTQDFCYGDITSTDTQVNGYGLYRTAASGTAYLLEVRLAVPTTSTYGLTFPWEANANPSDLLFQPFQLASKSPGDCRCTQVWELTTAFTGTADDVAGRTGTHLWEITNGYVTTQTKRWAYSSVLADSALGAALEEDNNPPPLAHFGWSFQEHLFLTGDVDNPSYLYWSKRFQPESFPTDQFIDIGTADDPLQGGVNIAGLCGVFSIRTKYRILGNATSGFVHQEAISRRGTPCPMAIAGTPYGAAFIARDGVFLTNFTSPDQDLTDDLYPLFIGETVNDMAPLDWAAASTFSGAIYKQRLYIGYLDTAGNRRLMVYSDDTKKWYFYDHPLRSLYYEEDTDLFVGGGLDGYVYILESGSSDQGSSIALDVETKDYSGENKDVRKLFQYLKVEADTGGATVTVQFYVDDTLVTTRTFSTTSRKVKLLSIEEGIMGTHWRMRFTYTGTTRIRVYPGAALYLPLSAA